MAKDPQENAEAASGGFHTARASAAKAARQARHMAPNNAVSPKAKANLFKAERHAEQTASFAELTQQEIEAAAAQGGSDADDDATRLLGASDESVAAPNADEGSTSDASSPGGENPYAGTDDAGEETVVVAPLYALGTPPPAEDEGEEKPGKHHSKKLVWGIVGGCAAALVAVYVGGALYFSNTFMPNTTVNGRDVSLMSKDDLKGSLDQFSMDYSLAVSGEGLNFTVEGGDIGLGIDGETYATEALEATEPWSWPATIWKARSITASSASSYDEEKLNELVGKEVSSLNEKAKAPEDATLVYSDDEDKFVVQDEEIGAKLDEATVQEGVKGAVENFADSYMVEENALLRPKITSTNDRLLAAEAQANSYLDTEVTLKMNGETAEVIGPDRIKDWVKIDDSLNPILDEAAITEWGRNDLSSRLDTVNRTRTYTRADGKTITVNGGSYGWSIDSASLTPLVVNAVMSGESQDVDVPILQSASTVPDEGGRDWGNRYIDVDLSEQYVRMYGDDGSIIWESECVSGDDSQNHNTPTGVWYIDGYFNKGNPATTLIGYKPDGTKDYESKVRYWMPFIGNSVGLHDADWRGSFGGSIYLYNGSHGCVNLPVSAAGELCSLVNQGDVVVTHY